MEITARPHKATYRDPADGKVKETELPQAQIFWGEERIGFIGYEEGAPICLTSRVDEELEQKLRARFGADRRIAQPPPEPTAWPKTAMRGKKLILLDDDFSDGDPEEEVDPLDE